MYLQFETRDDLTEEVIQLLQTCIDKMDQRAVKRHGYSWNKEEADFVPGYLKKE